MEQEVHVIDDGDEEIGIDEIDAQTAAATNKEKFAEQASHARSGAEQEIDSDST